jgi:hypothetical protein
MKKRVFWRSVALVVTLSVMVSLGYGLGQRVQSQFVAASQAKSINAYLGHPLAVPATECKSTAQDIANQLKDQLAVLKPEVSKTVGLSTGANPSRAAYDAFAKSRVIAESGISEDQSVSEVLIELGRTYGAKAVEESTLSLKSGVFLDAELNRLTQAKQLPSFVDTSGWGADFQKSYKSQCKKIFTSTYGDSAAQLSSSLQQLATFASSVSMAQWQGSAYSKVSPLVAYRNAPGGSCSTYSTCAIFLVESPTVCKAKFKVAFYDDSSYLDGTGVKTVTISKALQPLRVEVTDPGYSTGGTYEIKDVKCL